MPGIHRLQLTTFRNLASVDMAPSARFNLLFGENGSGKSSLLEAIHFLGLGRSFRNTRQAPLIRDGDSGCTVFVELADGTTLGINRNLDALTQMHIRGEKAQGAADLAKLLPLQLLNADAYKLLEGGPKARRQYLDWGVFHVEQGFHGHWREYRRSLQQRNILLKKRAPASQLDPWTRSMAIHARDIDTLRRSYLGRFIPFLEDLLGKLITIEGLDFQYDRGWSEADDIETALAANIDHDRSKGHTGSGPHRADLKLRIGSHYAAELLSRGQQKLLVCAMKLAQGDYLARTTGQQCLYLIDDLPAELDQENRQKICALLWQMGGQVFITGSEKNELLDSVSDIPFGHEECKLFHVKHGKLSGL